MTASAGPALKRLHEDFGDRVAFVSLYVREAHPGDRYPQPESFEQKMEHARAYRERDGLPWPVAVDDVDGSLHRALDPKPSSVYLMDREGRVAFRALWSNDEATVRDGLQAVVDGRTPERPERLNRVAPMTRGLGCQYEILDAGRRRRKARRAARDAADVRHGAHRGATAPAASVGARRARPEPGHGAARAGGRHRGQAAPQAAAPSEGAAERPQPTTRTNMTTELTPLGAARNGSAIRHEDERTRPRAQRVLVIGAIAGAVAGMMMAMWQMIVGAIADEPTAVDGISTSFWTAVTAIPSVPFGIDWFSQDFDFWPVVLGIGGHMMNSMLLGVLGVTLLVALLGLIVHLIVNPIQDVNTLYTSTPEWSWWASHAVFGMTLGLVGSLLLRRNAAADSSTDDRAARFTRS